MHLIQDPSGDGIFVDKHRLSLCLIFSLGMLMVVIDLRDGEETTEKDEGIREKRSRWDSVSGELYCELAHALLN